MTRLGNTTVNGAVVALALLLSVTVSTSHDHSWPESWGSGYAIRDPDPGFWRSAPGEHAGSDRAYSVGMSSLAAMSRVRIAPGSDLGLTNLGASGILVLESGALVLTEAEGLVGLRRGGAGAGTEPASVSAGAMLIRGDRITYQSSATVAFRNPEATSASLLMLTEIPDVPLSSAAPL